MSVLVRIADGDAASLDNGVKYLNRYRPRSDGKKWNRVMALAFIFAENRRLKRALRFQYVQREVPRRKRADMSKLRLVT